MSDPDPLLVSDAMASGTPGKNTVHVIVCPDQESTARLCDSSEENGDGSVDGIIDVTAVAGEINVDVSELLLKLRGGESGPTIQQAVKESVAEFSQQSPNFVNVVFDEAEEGGIAIQTPSASQMLSPQMQGENQGAVGTSTSQVIFSTPNLSSKSSQHSFISDADRRKIKFSNNVISHVVMYEVDNELYVGVEYERHWMGWVTLLLGLTAEVVFDVHLKWFLEPQNSGASFVVLQNWIAVMRLILSVVFFACCALLGMGISPSLEWSHTSKGILFLFAMALALSMALSMEVVAQQATNSSHFYVTTTLCSVWIIIYRTMTKEMIFFAEVFGVIVAVFGYVVCNLDADFKSGMYDAVTGNALLLISSGCFSLHYMMLAWIRQKCPMAPIIFWIGLVAPLAGVSLGAIYGAPFSGALSLYSCFDQQYVVHSGLIALEGLASNAFFLLSLAYLDVLSIATCYTVKCVLVPYFQQIILVDHSDGAQTSISKGMWGPYLFAGTPIALLGTFVVVYFASVKRQFVARRIAHSNRKKTPDPYKRKERPTNSRFVISAQYLPVGSL